MAVLVKFVNTRSNKKWAKFFKNAGSASRACRGIENRSHNECVKRFGSQQVKKMNLTGFFRKLNRK